MKSITSQGSVLTSRNTKEVLTRIHFEKQKRNARNSANNNPNWNEYQSSNGMILNQFNQCQVSINNGTINNQTPKKKKRNGAKNQVVVTEVPEYIIEPSPAKKRKVIVSNEK